MTSGPASTVHLRVDPASLVVRAARPATGAIALVAGEVAFPAADWDDFVIVILDAWLTALHRLATNTSDCECVYFLDGPYQVELARRAVDVVEVRSLERRDPDRQHFAVAATLPSLAASALDVAERVLQRCGELDHRSRDVEHLILAHQRLQGVAAQTRR
ncbi:MAG: hypothetical protein KBG28_27860 [Kofleriaceae bacterium]|jgi:hypothetical protein|nr:hypothetical protein [Kofleriaceae bacterium]MBP6842033.1 hypothetical protein [Kofleriaceae bacterium]MBP9207812.1 hypothetical protein [Kofleriaceae bacterium]